MDAARDANQVLEALAEGFRLVLAEASGVIGVQSTEQWEKSGRC